MLAHRPIRRIARLLATLSAASVHSTPALATATAASVRNASNSAHACAADAALDASLAALSSDPRSGLPRFNSRGLAFGAWRTRLSIG